MKTQNEDAEHNGLFLIRKREKQNRDIQTEVKNWTNQMKLELETNNSFKGTERSLAETPLFMVCRHRHTQTHSHLHFIYTAALNKVTPF